MNQTVKPNTQKLPANTVKEVTPVTAEAVIKETHVILPTRIAASGIAVNKTEYIVVDGITPYAYFYSFCGVYKGAVPTLRAYSQIVYCMDTDSYFAIDGHCRNNVYVLNCRLEETDKFSADCSQSIVGISLYEKQETNGNCSCCQVNPCGCEKQIFLTSFHEIYNYSRNGVFLNSFARCSKDVYLTSFVRTQDGYAESYEKNGCNYIRIVINCEEAELTIPGCTTLKTLFATDGGGIYGFFSKNYSNNFIVPLYENETLLPLTNKHKSSLLSTSFLK